MKARLEEISPVKKKLFIEISQETYLKKLDQAYQKLNQKVAIKGFRKGKTPRAILEKYYKEKTEADLFTELLEESYVWALKEQHVHAVTPPKISDLKKEDATGISYVAEVEVRPEVKLAQYREIPLKKTSTQPADREVEKELENLRESHAEIRPVEGNNPIQAGQIALIDFIGFKEGKPFEGGNAKGVSLELGKGLFLADFEAGIVGMSKGETKKVELTFPQDYPSAELAGQKVEFEITLNDIKEKNLPELNDDFARDLGDYNSLEEVKKKIREQIAAQKEQVSRIEMISQTVDFLIEKHPFEMPEGMIEQELDIMWDNALRSLRERNATPEQAGLEPQSYRAQNREAAIRRLKAFFLFEAVAIEEKIQITPEDLNAKIEKIAQSVGQPVHEVRKYYIDNKMVPYLQTQLLEEKVVDRLFSQAKITEE